MILEEDKERESKVIIDRVEREKKNKRRERDDKRLWGEVREMRRKRAKRERGDPIASGASLKNSKLGIYKGMEI